MGSLSKKQSEFIKSLKIENFKGIYFVANDEKLFVKIKGLDLIKITKRLSKRKENYKTFKNFKYFIRSDKMLVATDEKNSYLTSLKIKIEDIANNFDIEQSANLKSLIKESKNNGFYVSFYNEAMLNKISAKFPKYLQTLKGFSLFSYNDKKDKITKVKFLAKLDSKDASEAAIQLNNMFNVYKPMIYSQIKNYENMLLAKKELKGKEKELYQRLINEFKDMASSIKIESKANNLFVTMNIKSLESAITIIGVASAFAIPIYQGYIKRSRIHAVQENFNASVRLIKNELVKGKTGDKAITNDLIKELNKGNKKSPTNNEKPAFELGSKSVPYGTIVISVTDLRAIKTGETVTIYAPNYNKAMSFGLKDVSITKE